MRQGHQLIRAAPSRFDDKRISRLDEFTNMISRFDDKRIPVYKISEKVYKMNFAQIYPEDRGVNFGVREAKKISKII